MSCPLHLTLNLDERLSYMMTLPPSSTHVATSSVARIYVVHQTPKPKLTSREHHCYVRLNFSAAAPGWFGGPRHAGGATGQPPPAAGACGGICGGLRHNREQGSPLIGEP